MKPIKCQGLIAASFTPLRANGALNVPMIQTLAESLIANHVFGAFVCGTTGEAASLTVAERQQVAEQWITSANKKLKIIVHVGHTCLEDCRTLARHAQQINADAIGCYAPFFFKPANAETLTDFCAEVAAAAPDLPFYYYHIPVLTGTTVAASSFLKTAAPRIPNLAGIKFTHEDLQDFMACLQFENGRYDIVFGRDQMMLPGLAAGATGAIGSTFNFAAPVYHRIIAAFQRGDMAIAREEQARANAMIEVFIRFGGLAAGKSFMKIIGLDCGNPRLPLRTLSASQYADLQSELNKIDFSSFASATNKQPL